MEDKLSTATTHKTTESLECNAHRGTTLASASIKSSRRRIKKGSSVVLNTHRLEKYKHKQTLEQSLEEDSVLRPKEKKMVSPSSVSIRSYSCKIQRWWRKLIVNRMLRFEQYGKWSSELAYTVFSVFLGFRVRRTLKKPIIQAKFQAQRDIFKVLNDLLSNITKSDLKTDHNTGAVTLFIKYMDNPSSLKLAFPSISPVDVALAQSLVKQLLAEKENLHKLLFLSRRWRSFPSPGFWDFSVTAAPTAVASKKNVFSPSRQTIRSPSKASESGNQPGFYQDKDKSVPETPPHLKNAISRSKAMQQLKVPSHQQLVGNTQPSLLREIMSDFPEMPEPKLGAKVKARVGKKPTSLKSLLTSKMSVAGDQSADEDESLFDSSPSTDQNEEGVSVNRAPVVGERAIKPTTVDFVEKVEMELNNLQESGSKGQQSSFTTPTPQKVRPVMSSDKISPQTLFQAETPVSCRSRRSRKGHIQLDILSADKLMAAKKGAKLRDQNGGSIPDRKPGLKVTLFLPQIGTFTYSGESGNFKKVVQLTKDFEEYTLFPRWGHSFCVNLPCNKSILQQIMTAHNFSADYVTDENKQYSFFCRHLLDWWSSGKIVIEVLDGERFNEDIFLGSVDLLLSGFLVLIKKPDDLEIKGSFPLQKRVPTERVSGTLKLHAYLHVPEQEYLLDLLNGNSQINPSQSQQNPLLFPSAGSGHRTDEEDEGIPEESEEGRSGHIQSPRKSIKVDGSPMKYSSNFMKSLLSSVDASNPTSARPQTADTFSDPQLEESSNIVFKNPDSGGVGKRGRTPTVRSSSRAASTAQQRKAVLAGKKDVALKITSPEGGKQGSVEKIGANRARDSSDIPDPLSQSIVSRQRSKSSGRYSERSSTQRRWSVEGGGAAVDFEPQYQFSSKSTKVATSLAKEGGAMRRTFIADITKQLDGLNSAVQHSTDEVLGLFQKKLQAKREHQQDSSKNEKPAADLGALSSSPDSMSAMIPSGTSRWEEQDAPEMHDSENEGEEKSSGSSEKSDDLDSSSDSDSDTESSDSDSTSESSDADSSSLEVRNTAPHESASESTEGEQEIQVVGALGSAVSVDCGDAGNDYHVLEEKEYVLGENPESPGREEWLDVGHLMESAEEFKVSRRPGGISSPLADTKDGRVRLSAEKRPSSIENRKPEHSGNAIAPKWRRRVEKAEIMASPAKSLPSSPQFPPPKRRSRSRSDNLEVLTLDLGDMEL